MKMTENSALRRRSVFVAVIMTFTIVALTAGAFVGGNNVATAATGVSFSMDIVPLFVETCTVCHGGETASDGSAGLNLGAEFAYDNLVGVQARPFRPAEGEEQEFDFFRVTPGVPEVSYLLHKLLGTQRVVNGSGGQMPRGLDPWTEEQIDLLRQWILAGAPNN